MGGRTEGTGNEKALTEAGTCLMNFRNVKWPLWMEQMREGQSSSRQDQRAARKPDDGGFCKLL